MSNAAEHRATALKWLKSTETMNELFLLETELVKMIARYNLAKSNLSDDIGEIAIGLHYLVDKFERLLDEGKSGAIVSGHNPVISPNSTQRAGGIIDRHLDSAPSQSSISDVESTLKTDDSDKPENWDSLTIPERIAYRNSLASDADIDSSFKRKADKLSDIRTEVEVIKAQIINPTLQFVDDKFNLTNRVFNEHF